MSKRISLGTLSKQDLSNSSTVIHPRSKQSSDCSILVNEHWVPSPLLNFANNFNVREPVMPSSVTSSVHSLTDQREIIAVEVGLWELQRHKLMSTMNRCSARIQTRLWSNFSGENGSRILGVSKPRHRNTKKSSSVNSTYRSASM